MKLEWSADDEAFRAELVAFIEEYAPTEAKAGRDFTEGGGFEIPAWAREWQATLFDHGWMIPAYPPELGGRNATPTQTLIYMEELARRRIPRSLHFPGLRHRRAEPAGVRQRRAAQAGGAVDSRRPRVVHRHERAQRGQRPRVAHDPRRPRRQRRPLHRQRPEGVDVVLDGRREVLLLRAHRSARAQAQGHQRADHRHGHAGHRRPPAPAPHGRRGLCRGVLHRRRGAGRQPRGRAQRRLAHHDGLARPRARRPLAPVRRDGAADRRRSVRARSPVWRRR